MHQVIEQAESLALPDSVVQYFRGEIGQPPGGFPEPITSRVRKGRPMATGDTHFTDRPVCRLMSREHSRPRRIISFSVLLLLPIQIRVHRSRPIILRRRGRSWRRSMAVRLFQIRMYCRTLCIPKSSRIGRISSSSTAMSPTFRPTSSSTR